MKHRNFHWKPVDKNNLFYFPHTRITRENKIKQGSLGKVLQLRKLEVKMEHFKNKELNIFDVLYIALMSVIFGPGFVIKK